MHNEDWKNAKKEKVASCLFILYSFKRTPKGPSLRSFLDFVRFVVILLLTCQGRTEKKSCQGGLP